MSERTTVEDLKLQGATGNLRRALKREQAEGGPPPLSIEAQSELQKLDALIAQALKNCKRGATFRKKPNPAFRQLESLMRCRAQLTRGQKTNAKKSVADVLAEADRLLGGVN